MATGSLITRLRNLYTSEVSEAEHSIIGQLYEFDHDEDQWERAVGATQFQPKPDHERHGFSTIDKMIARRGVIEIGESLAFVSGLIARYDPQHQVNLTLQNARARNKAVGSHVGLSPERATQFS